MSGTERGVTMIESLMAMVVFSIGGLGVIRLQLESIRSNRFGGHMTQAALLAEERAEMLQALDFDNAKLLDAKTSNNPATAASGFPYTAGNVTSPAANAESSTAVEALKLDGSLTTIGNGEVYQRYYMVADLELNANTAGADAKQIRVVTRFRDGQSSNWREVGVTVVKAKAY